MTDDGNDFYESAVLYRVWFDKCNFVNNLFEHSALQKTYSNELMSQYATAAQTIRMELRKLAITYDSSFSRQQRCSTHTIADHDTYEHSKKPQIPRSSATKA